MKREEMKGKISTVLGFIDPEDLGFTLAHEHLVIDFRAIFKELPYASDRYLAMQPVTMENLEWVKKHRFSVLDNLLLLDEKEAIDEVNLYRNQGGEAIVEVSNKSFARDPMSLFRISISTGIHIVMGGGYYTARSHDLRIKNIDIDELAEEFISEIQDGVDDTGIRPGVLGEIGCSWPLEESEKKVLKAAAKAQKKTGILINIHPGWSESAPLEILEILVDSGAEPNHVAFSHTDRTLLNHKARIEVLKTGSYLIYDSIGREGYFDLETIIDIPNDNYRVNDIMKLMDAGYANKIMLSADVCTKDMRVKYGGHGYVHIPKYFVPLLRRKGMCQEAINKLLIHNPSASLTFF
ncbi:phosphotriesterase family protein [Sporanaerobacter acetigenes]|uniref:phosphotriesterase family protein n=1 Tax=Sporanaerobacter acetigenes TaxID=165813 RepID=UPI003326DF32